MADLGCEARPAYVYGPLMAGRPALRIGQRGKITRTYLGGGVWEARCRYREH